MNKFEYDPQVIIRSINEVESKFPVNKWTINGVQFWPFIRTSLAYTQRKNLEVSDKNKAKDSHKRLLYRYARIFIFLPYHFAMLKLKLGKARRIFVGASTHRVNVNGIRANKYFDVAITDFRSKKDYSVILDRGTSLDKSDYPNKDSWFSLPAVYVMYVFLRRVKLKRPGRYQPELEGYDEFYNYLLENFQNVNYLKTNFSKRSIVAKMKVFHDRKVFLKGLLKNTKVENAYFLCYYSSLYYPLIAACNELSIKTIDVQHGGMGKGHWSYDSWSCAPPTGYALLPRFFWTWDENSAALINTWAATTAFHKAIAMGRPWLNDYAQSTGYAPGTTNYILYNLADVMLEPYIIEAMRQLGKQKHWIVRMHPRMVSKRNVLEQQIEEHALREFVSIEDSTQVLLSDSLQYCSAFISAASSGSVIEALQAGRKPVLLPSPGANYYDGYIRSGDVKMLTEKNASELVTAIGEASGNINGQEHKETPGIYENKFIDFEQMIR